MMEMIIATRINSGRGSRPVRRMVACGWPTVNSDALVTLKPDEALEEALCFG